MLKELSALKNFCFYYYQSVNVPIYLFDGKEQIIQYPNQVKVLDPISRYLPELLATEDNVAYTITKQFVYYGIIKITDTNYSLIVGPVSSTANSAEAIKDIMNDAHIPYKMTKEFVEFFQQISIYSFAHFLNILCFLHYTCNQEHISIEALSEKVEGNYEAPVLQIFTTNYFSAKEQQIMRSSYYLYGEEYLRYIQQGNLDALKKMFKKPVTLHTGILADNNIRQKKNLAVINTALSARAAIKGGLDIEIAYQLHDVYIREIERTHDYKTLHVMQIKIILDFAQRVREVLIPPGKHSVLYKAMHYITHNTNRPLSVTDVAEAVELSRSYLSLKFKEEFGISVNAFIIQRKLEEAQNLLAFTNKSISEISNYLCFSSQSYFQRVFKNACQMTPKQYRDHNHYF